MGHISESIAAYGIRGDDVIRATGFFAGLSVAWVAILWSSCFIIRPTERIISRLPFPRLQAAFARGQEKAEKYKIFKRLPANKRGVVTVSFCEAITLKGMLGPVALPVRIWLAAKLAMMTRSDSKKGETSDK